jgi:hypothetical protein
MIGVDSGVDSKSGLPVHTLYGPTVASLTPTSKQLEGLDAIVFDVQDMGSRYYTFAATMLYAMKAAAPLGLRFFVLDRPNPIGGAIVEGPTIRDGYFSFVGAHPTPIRHGMTVGDRTDGDPLRGLETVNALARNRPSLDPPLAEHAHSRHGAGLSRRLPDRRHESLRRSRNDTTV